MTTLTSNSVFGAPKREWMYLLGAGASADAGLPMAFQLSTEIRKGLKRSGTTRYLQVVDYVMAELMVERSLKSEDPFAGVDAERFMAATRFLARRNDSEVARFVATWSRGLEQVTRSLSRPTPKTIDLADHLIRKFSGTPAINPELATNLMSRLLAQAIDSQEMESADSVFKEIELDCLMEIQSLLTVQRVEAVQYLETFLKPAKKKGLNIATLNYDDTIEVACRSSNIPCHEGISRWNDTFQLDFSDTGVNLLKLHGSITWWAESPYEFSRMSAERKRFVTAGPVGMEFYEDEYYWPQIIFGEGNKLTHEGPFLQLYLAFRELLFSAESLVVVGYSFRDDHVNACVRDFLFRSRKSKLIIVAPRASRTNAPFIRFLHGERGSQIEFQDYSAKEWISLRYPER